MNSKTLEHIQQRLEQAKLAGHIYQQDQILVLQEPFTEDGAALNIFVQHDLTADQLGLQFGLNVLDEQIEFLIGVTHSNQDRSSEIGTWNLKGEQKAFNLCYAFYNYPKHFYLLRCPLHANTDQVTEMITSQLFAQAELDFLNTALKTNPMGLQHQWMKDYILELSLEMKVRIQTALN
ncbi:hypothetical protein [Acinetobacter shaoyimingii]|uniref:Uncharacterized protein n=1 Tax=Acinetobacter shaoyimingii TaxID=2715164 RepID=A0A6G8RTR9_9GAMM|nr:hypothetical protein [Acinetobacter shaoyimingii]NHB58902.1 hypothetical protein [Acinetobacter shaoyimingii]QIO05285.1 hypothetical protein G8E00_04565 [Acinetobacter shaoyimingii]